MPNMSTTKEQVVDTREMEIKQIVVGIDDLLKEELGGNDPSNSHTKDIQGVDERIEEFHKEMLALWMN